MSDNYDDNDSRAVLSMSPDIAVETTLKLRLEVPDTEDPEDYKFQDVKVSMERLSYVLRSALWLIDADNKGQGLRDPVNELRKSLEHAGMSPRRE